ncbi:MULTISPECIES: hypothetical protein [Sphingobium]|uniref:DUF4386 domain-containing protein n=1 Tax=Sphingobium ummariense RL-3 TaxID=1346791 RepID=T0J6J0_9SPHN|nr:MULTISPECIES: hypothetical protein [Sphingobium]EQB33591.1 hypothetical protein M529_03470 [Sphingobium ummariense RL-3]
MADSVDPSPSPYRYVWACAWGGPIFLAASLLFWGLLARNIPPFTPNVDAQLIADHFRQHKNAIRTGMVLTMAFSVFYFVWGVAISKVMRAVERDNDVLSTLQLGGALFTTLITLLPAWIWLGAAYRPEALSPIILQLLYDIGWLLFVVAYSLTSVQAVAVGICFLADRRPTPLIPNWLGWFSIWAGTMLAIETVMPFFPSGPFSRSGILNFWIEFSIFFTFIFLLSVYILRAIARLEREHRAGDDRG